MAAHIKAAGYIPAEKPINAVIPTQEESAFQVATSRFLLRRNDVMRRPLTSEGRFRAVVEAVSTAQKLISPNPRGSEKTFRPFVSTSLY
jgi:hypothetical protein